MKSEELREKFASFFKTKAHSEVSSSSLIPQNDPTVLFTTAGMQQFVPNLMGESHEKGRRLFSVQKCFRTPDIDEIGDDTHHTFFEMLGNWSLGDYFKEKAIDFAYDFFVYELRLNPNKFAITIFKGNKDIPRDTEAENFWLKKGIKKEQIFEFDEEDNFWGPTGKTGPCGPCSEIYYDRGESYGEDLGPNSGNDRFVEIWNLVFMEYEKKEDQTFQKLEQKNVDTGVGFERLLALMQNKNSSFETDLFQDLIQKIEKSSHKKYIEFKEDFRIFADHIRGAAFLISDGVIPSNESRGYVLRRLLRRAILKIKKLEISDENFISVVIDEIVKKYDKFYPELVKNATKIKAQIKSENESFQKTLERGKALLDEIISKNPQSISGKDAFLLFDTYGFPLEITAEIASQKGVEVDKKGFEKEMKLQKERSRKGSKAMFEEIEEFTDLDKTKFLGYEKNEIKTEILDLKKFEKDKGHFVKVTLKETPLYAESGGQIGDHGKIEGDVGAIKVIDVQKNKKGTYIHIGEVVQGNLKQGEKVTIKINGKFRSEIKKHHSATHILHAVLRDVFGKEISQKGSWVSNKKARFDFSVPQKISPEDLNKIQHMVNAKIDESLEVSTEILDKEKALAKGALAFFDDKYEDKVRVVSIGKYSTELCGGTHVDNTSEIGTFLILKESSIASGIRRIEFVCGQEAKEILLRSHLEINEISKALSCKEEEVKGKVESLLQEHAESKKKLDSLSQQDLEKKLDSILKEAKDKEVNAEIEVEDLKKAAFYLHNKGAHEVFLVNPKTNLFVILSTSGIAKKRFEKLKNGKGGGNERFYSGKILPS